MADIRSIKVTKVTAGYSGTNKNGNPFTIYDIEAEGVTHKLRSFDNLPLGDNQYEVTVYSKDGQSTYTLKPHNFKVPRADSAGGVNEGDLQEIKNRLGRIEAHLGFTRSDVTPPPDQWPSGSDSSQSPQDDKDDIPF